MSTYRILIVDDQHEIRRMLHSWLDTLGPGFEVLAMPSGEEALYESSRRAVDLLIADFRLPGINGLELMERMKKPHPNVKVILITGLTDAKVMEKVSAAGAFAYFIKPIEMDDFLNAVQRALGIIKTRPLVSPAASGARPSKSLPERLAALRKDLNASSVLLMNAQGEVVAQAGDLPVTSGASSLLPTVLAAFSASAKISYLLGSSDPLNLLHFSGPDHHLALTPVGKAHALLVALERKGKDDLLGAKGRTILQWADELYRDGLLDTLRPDFPEGVLPEGALSSPAAVISPVEAAQAPAEELQEVSPEELAALDTLFSQKDTQELDSKDVDNFWNQIADKANPNETRNPDALSYEEARKLGLAPKGDSQ